MPKIIQRLSDVSGMKKKVKLFALVTNRKTLEWINPYSDKKIPEFIPQMENENGSKTYEVLMPYAMRLLSGEPYKYFLADPDVIGITVPTAAGGKEEKLIFAKIEKVEKRQVYKEKPESKPVLAEIKCLNDDGNTYDIIVPKDRLIKSVKKSQLSKEDIVIRDEFGLPVLVDKDID